MWLITEYHPAALFSLKVGVATSTGAKTLFLPTPFAIRTAFLDAGIRTRGIDAGAEIFDALKSLRLAARPPERIVVTNLFAKVLKPQRRDKKGEEDDEDADSAGAMQRSIAFREYAHLDGILALAFEGEAEALAIVESLASQVNYFGKRGSFFQLAHLPRRVETLPNGFTRLDEGLTFENGKVMYGTSAAFPLGIIQLMDDWGAELTFDKVNVYAHTRIAMFKDRVRRSVIFPYRLARSSRGFSFYEMG
ncbi:MAG: hypothetical protein N2559_16950 [Anaerolineae bacterium]|nr:hypothetical protein [Anaerolineae bacterium]